MPMKEKVKRKKDGEERERKWKEKQKRSQFYLKKRAQPIKYHVPCTCGLLSGNQVQNYQIWVVVGSLGLLWENQLLGPIIEDWP